MCPYAFPKNRVTNTLVIPLNDIRTNLPQSFRDGINHTEIEYQLVVTVDIPLAPDVIVRLPIKIVVPGPIRSKRMIDPVLQIPTGDAFSWTVLNVKNWIVYKLLLPGLANVLERFALDGSDLLMLEPSSIAGFISQGIADSPDCPPDAKANLIAEVGALYRRFTLSIRLLNAQSLQQYKPLFASEKIEADDLYRLTDLALFNAKVPIGPRIRILKAIEALAQTGAEGEQVLLSTGRMP